MSASPPNLFRDFVDFCEVEFRENPNRDGLLAFLIGNEAVIRRVLDQAVAAAQQQRLPPNVIGPDLPPVPTTDYSFWSPAQRLRINVAALRLLRSKVLDVRQPTPEERAVLAGYSGWGGISDFSNLTEDAKVWTPEEVADIRAIKAGKIPTGNTFRGALNQYFTPLGVASAMWGLTRRVGSPFLPAAPRVLEPSAGVGRFVAAAPTDLEIDWTLVEADPLESGILQQLWPTARHFAGLFESWCAENPPRSQFDVVIANPPYTDRGGERETDPRDAQWVDGSLYFLVAAARRLKPGGVMVQIHTWDVISRVGGEQQRAREELLKLCHFAGAGFPPYTIFSRIGAGTGLAVSCWIRRHMDLPAVGAEDLDIARGAYRESPEGQANLLGPLVPHRRSMLVGGAFSPEALVNIQLRPLSDASISAIEEARKNLHTADPLADRAAPRRGRRTKSAEQATAGKAVFDEPALQWAQVLGARYIRYRTLLNSNPAAAELQRKELCGDVQAFLAAHGVPGSNRAVTAAAREDVSVRSFLTAFLDGGEIAPVLTAPVSTVTTEDYRGNPQDVEAIITYYSARRGFCLMSDIERFPTGLSRSEVHDRVLSHRGGFCIEPIVDPLGHPWRYYAEKDYLQGDLWGRHDMLVAWLASSGDTDREVAQIRHQLDLLLTAIRPLDLDALLETGDDSPVQLRAGFVPVQVLEAFLQAELSESTLRLMKDPTTGLFSCEGVTLDSKLALAVLAYLNRSTWIYLTDKKMNRYTLLRKRYSKPPTAWMGISVIGDPDNVLTAEERAEKARLAQQLQQLEEVDEGEGDEDDDEKGKKADRISAVERAQIDLSIESAFRMWLRNNPVPGEQLVASYNRTVRGTTARDFAMDELRLARMSPEYHLGWHQSRAARRIAAVGSAIVAHDVGLGKTLLALASIFYQRQHGRARRPLVVCPKKVVANWRREVQRFFPDARVLVFGRRWAPSVRRWIRVSVAEKQGQWQAFASGAYDLAVISYEDFATAQPSPQTVYNIMAQQVWLQREMGLSGEEKSVAKGRIETARQAVEDLRRLAENRLRHDPNSKFQSTVEAVEKLRKKEIELARLQNQVKAPTVRALEAAKLEAEKAVAEKSFAQDRTLVSWEDVGVDMLVVDEAHNFKGLWTAQPQGGQIITGMGGGEKSDSKRAWDLFYKAQHVLATHGNQGVVLLTATPLVNSPLDLFNLYCYISQDLWVQRGIPHHEAFIERFIKTAVRFQVTTDGDPVQRMTVVGFRGSDDLGSVNDRYLDFLTADDVNAVAAAGVDPSRPEHAPGFAHEGEWGRGKGPTLQFGGQTLHSIERWRMRGSQGTVVDVIDNPDSREGGFLVVRWNPAFPVAVPVLVPGTSSANLPTAREARAHALAWIHKPVKVPEAHLPPAELVEADPLQEEVYESIRQIARAVSVCIRKMFKTMGNDPEKRAELIEISRLLRYLVVDRLTKASLDPRVACATPISDKVADMVSGLSAQDQAEYGINVGQVLSSIDHVNSFRAPADYVPQKFVAVAHKIAASRGCGHLVFCDANVVHDDLRRAISEISDIPLERIGVIQGNNGGPYGTDEEERLVIADLFNGTDARQDDEGNDVPPTKPTLDVLICQTEAAGEGLNLQRRTCAIHHLTIPWTPNKLQQRNGRGLRHGNAREAVSILYYMLAFPGGRVSFDAYRVNLISVKDTWQRDLLRARTPHALNNPAANASIDFGSLLAMLADNPEEAMELLRLRREAARMEENQERRTRALATLSTTIGIGNRLVYASSRYSSSEEARRKRKQIEGAVRDIRLLIRDGIVPESAENVLGDIGYRPFTVFVDSGEVFAVYAGMAYPLKGDRWVVVDEIANFGGIIARHPDRFPPGHFTTVQGFVSQLGAGGISAAIPADDPTIRAQESALVSSSSSVLPFDNLREIPADYIARHDAALRKLLRELRVELGRYADGYKESNGYFIVFHDRLRNRALCVNVYGISYNTRQAVLSAPATLVALLPTPEDREVFSDCVARGEVYIGEGEYDARTNTRLLAAKPITRAGIQRAARLLGAGYGEADQIRMRFPRKAGSADASEDESEE